MAEEHNAIKYGGPISSAAAIAAGGGYGDVGVSRLSETLTPILDLWSRPEFALLRGERRWNISPSNIAVAAEFSQVGVRNPAGSGMLVVVEDFNLIDGPPSTIIECRVAASSVVDATSTPNARDTRLPLLTGIRTVSMANAAAARLGSIMQRYAINGNTYSYYPVGFVLSPGFDLFFGPDTVLEAIEVTIRGYERIALPGELQARG